MIPRNIKRGHVARAIQQMDRERVPEGRNSKKFLLECEGKFYPPKYVISLANMFANGKELSPSEFSGGKESNDFLMNLGFKIVGKDVSGGQILKVPEETKTKVSRVRHDERCPECKETIKKMLERTYGKVYQNYKLEIGTLPEDFKNSQHYARLKEIHAALQNQRGFSEFVRSSILPRCDFFVPDPGFVVEFDESQHFTILRKIALEHYPQNLELGFNRDRWTAICDKINAKDNDPPFRDEQRAWYDTLRDFIPVLKGLKPTIRLFAGDYEWCGLDPDDPSDARKFEHFLRREKEQIKIEVMEDLNPFLARIIIAGDWEGKPEDARRLLEEVCGYWPKDKKAKFLITCGGFMQFDWPRSVSKKEIGSNRNPNAESMDVLAREAKKCAEYVLGDGLSEKLRGFTNYITLGIDSYKEKISTTKNFIGEPHVELVFLIDLRNNRYYWTGKSYPTTGQEKGLVRIADLRSHFFDLEGAGKIMILGCHDLTIFNNRNWEKTGKWRKGIKEEFRALAKKEGPSIVFQHPHTSDCINVWSPAWHTLRQLIGNVGKYASAGRWPHIDYHAYNKGKKKGEPHCMLEDVLEKTKIGSSIDFIVHR
jgi:hypothetical protein